MEALLLRDRNKFFKLPLRLLKLVESRFMFSVDFWFCLLELDVLLRNMKKPLPRLSVGVFGEDPLSTSK